MRSLIARFHDGQLMGCHHVARWRSLTGLALLVAAGSTDRPVRTPGGVFGRGCTLGLWVRRTLLRNSFWQYSRPHCE